MEPNNNFHKTFGKKPVIGMIHLAGKHPEEKIKRALEEIALFEEEGVDAALVENYHGDLLDVIRTINRLQSVKPNIKLGVNILPNDFNSAFNIVNQYNCDFIQLDYVAGKYEGGYKLYTSDYSKSRETSKAIVLGGVWPKYYQPIEGSIIATDIKDGMKIAEAIVVTGEGTGIETPIEKIKQFREILGNHPLIIGAGTNPDNIYEQLKLADGVIVGSGIKEDYNTRNPVSRELVKKYMSEVRRAREYSNL